MPLDRAPQTPHHLAHTTAQEILADFADAPLDAIVTGVGTGGHITGIAEALKKGEMPSDEEFTGWVREAMPARPAAKVAPPKE